MTRIYGRGGREIICGGNGRDTVNGGSGRDRIFGESANDTLKGGSGFDRLDGGTGLDACYAGADGGTKTACEPTDLAVEMTAPESADEGERSISVCASPTSVVCHPAPTVLRLPRPIRRRPAPRHHG